MLDPASHSAFDGPALPRPVGRWIGLAREIAPTDPLALVDHPEVSCFWDCPDDAGARFVGVGVSVALSDSPTLAAGINAATAARIEWWSDPPEIPGPWFGGFAFDPRRARSPGWAGFPASQWLLPRFALGGRGGRTWVMAFSQDRAGLTPAYLEAGLAMNVPALAGERRPQSWRLRDDRHSWDTLVARALTAIEEGTLLKLVAARGIHLELSDDLDVSGVLGSLRQRFPSCVSFLLRGADGAYFLGATPETLVRRRGMNLETVALAGSVSVVAGLAGVTDKEQREHDAVRDGIRRSLAPFTTDLEVDSAPGLVTLRNIAHLRSGVRARLRGEGTLGAVVEAVHPTAALGGSPTEAALAFLREHEGLDRGWYGGGVGWLGEHEAHLAVAIRSALVRGRNAEVFAGAGLVAGSRADLEWEETRQKASAMLGALGGLP